MNPADGDVITISVTATNGAGGVSAAVSTTHVVDTTAPVAGSVFDGPTPGVDIDFQTSASMSVTWQAFTEPHTSVSYDVEVCETVAVPEVCVVASPVGASTSYTAAGLPLSPSVSYFVRVTGTNEAGLTAQAVSDGFVIDASAPVAGVVRDGIEEIDAQVQGTWNFAANWDAWTDDESPITRYEWCLGSSIANTDVMACTDVGLQLWAFASESSTSAERPSVVYVTVKGYNAAGSVSVARSNGVLVDLSPPIVGDVYHGAPSNSQFANTTSCNHALEVTWDAATDDETDIATYHVSVGTTPGGVDVLDSQLVTGEGARATESNSIDARPTAVLDSLTLVDGQRYYVTVTATNGAYTERRLRRQHKL